MTISIDDFVLFCERTLDGYRDVIERLDDDELNRQPELPASNTPAQIMVHALSACRWWCEHVVLGQPSDRDRPAEFEAIATGDELRRLADSLAADLNELAPRLGAATDLAFAAQTTERPLPGGWTVGRALIHAYEELAQHLGHLEVTADLIGGSRR